MFVTLPIEDCTGSGTKHRVFGKIYHFMDYDGWSELWSFASLTWHRNSEYAFPALCQQKCFEDVTVQMDS